MFGLEDVTKRLRSQCTVSANQWIQFCNAMHIFKYCPVLNISGKLIPLNPLQTSSDAKPPLWDCDCIGFNPHSPLQVKKEDYLRA
eukprot:15337717-Ditylum_brightwellii.AAC.1